MSNSIADEAAKAAGTNPDGSPKELMPNIARMAAGMEEAPSTENPPENKFGSPSPVEILLHAQAEFIKAQQAYIHAPDLAAIAMAQEVLISAQMSVLQIYGVC